MFEVAEAYEVMMGCLAQLSEDHRAALRQRLRQNLFANHADGPFILQAKAWAVRGIVPDK